MHQNVKLLIKLTLYNPVKLSSLQNQSQLFSHLSKKYQIKLSEIRCRISLNCDGKVWGNLKIAQYTLEDSNEVFTWKSVACPIHALTFWYCEGDHVIFLFMLALDKDYPHSRINQRYSLSNYITCISKATFDMVYDITWLFVKVLWQVSVVSSTQLT